MRTGTFVILPVDSAEDMLRPMSGGTHRAGRAQGFTTFRAPDIAAAQIVHDYEPYCAAAVRAANRPRSPLAMAWDTAMKLRTS